MTPSNPNPTAGNNKRKSLYVVLVGSDIRSHKLLISLLRDIGRVRVPSSSLKETQRLLRREPALAICQASSSDGTFRELLGALRSGSRVPVIICGDSYDPRLYVEAMNLGAFDYFDYFTYPYYNDGVETVVDNALRQAWYHTSNS